MTDQPTEADQPRERLCQVCNRTPVTHEGRGTDQTCARCLGTTRIQLNAIVVMATALLGEAITRNINSEAAALAGPIADIATWTDKRMAALHGAPTLADRIDPRWLDDQVDMHHPSWVLGTWEREARTHLSQTHASHNPTLTAARDYLDLHLTGLAQDQAFPFNELAEDIRLCHTHIERVLHLEEHIDRGAPCPNCTDAKPRPNLRKSYGTSPADDRWTCPRCRTWWSDEDYRNRVSDDYLANHLATATRLTAAEFETHHRVTASTIRTWVQRDHLQPLPVRDKRGRQLFAVADVLALRDTPTTAASS